MESFFHSLLSLVSWGLLIALGLGGFGALFDGFDSLAVFRVPLICGTFGAGMYFVATRRWVGFGIAAVLILSLSPSLIDYLPKRGTKSADDFRLYQKNLYFGNADLEPLIADIQAQGPQIVVLEEVTPEHAVALQSLREAYLTNAFCEWDTVGGVMILSTLPMIGDAECLNSFNFLAVRLGYHKGPLRVIGLHHSWPWPVGRRNGYTQARQARQMTELLSQSDLPTLIAGDFNHVAWSARVQGYARKAGAIRLGPIINTIDIAGIGLPIDHILVPKGTHGYTTRRPKLGSDHFGLLARFSLAVPSHP